MSWSESNGFDNDSKFRYSLGADVKISRFDDTYFKLTLGTETGEDTTSDGGFVLGNLKVGF